MVPALSNTLDLSNRPPFVKRKSRKVRIRKKFSGIPLIPDCLFETGPLNSLQPNEFFTVVMTVEGGW